MTPVAKVLEFGRPPPVRKNKSASADGPSAKGKEVEAQRGKKRKVPDDWAMR
jgi:hypothetical protein